MNISRLYTLAVTLVAFLSLTSMSLAQKSEREFLQKALVQFSQGNSEQAVKTCTKCISKYPSSSRCYSYRGFCYRFQGDIDKAKIDFEKTVLLAPQSPHGWFGMGCSQFQDGKYDEAILSLTRAIQLKEGYADAYYMRSLVQATREDYDAAIGDATKAIKLEDELPHLVSNRAEIYEAMGELQLAMADYQAAINLHPNYSENFISIALIQLQLKDTTAAYEMIAEGFKNCDYKDRLYIVRQDMYFAQERIEEADKDADAFIASFPENVNAYRLKANVNFRNRKPDEAFEMLDKALIVKPDHVPSLTHYAFAILDLERDPNTALKYTNKALSINPNSHFAHHLAAKAYLKLLENQKALEHCQMAIKSKPEKLQYHNTLGSIYMNLWKLDNAIAEFNFVLERDTDYFYALTSRALSHDYKKDYKSSLKDYNTALAMGINDTLIYNNRGLVYMNLEMYAEALEDFNKAIEFDPSAPFYYNNRGFCKFKTGDTDGALTDIDKSLSMLPTNSYAYKNKALVYISMKKRKDACKMLKKADSLGYSKKYGPEVTQLLQEYCK